MSYGALTNQEDGSGMQQACSSGRITSRYRGLYYDTKHSSFRVRIFYLGKQRHIGRYKDETMAAQAYDRAAYYLYGTRANLNFRLKDVLADTQDVPASIKQAKEQASAGYHSARPVTYPTGATSSSSSSASSACSYSPHHQYQGCPAAGAHFGHSSGGAVYLHQQQPQLVQHTPAQQQQQQPMFHQQHQQQHHHHQQQQVHVAAAAWAPGMQQQQHQQLAGGPMQVNAHMLTQRQQLVPGTGVRLVDTSQPHLQQQATPGVVMPDVVASVIAALDLPPQSAPPATSTAAAAAGPACYSAWPGCSSAGVAGMQPAVHGAGLALPGWVGVSSGSSSSAAVPGFMLTEQGAAVAISPAAPWVPQGASTIQLQGPAAVVGSYQQQPGQAECMPGSAAVFIQQQQQHQQQHMQLLQVQQQEQAQLRMQLQAQCISAPQQLQVGAGVPPVLQQGGLPVMLPAAAVGGVVLSSAQLSAAPLAGSCHQQPMLMSAAML